MKQSDIAALPDDPVALKRKIAELAAIITSYEAAKALRAKEEKIEPGSLAASVEMAVFQTKGLLEGLADGSEDIADKGSICRSSIKLIDRLFAAVPKS